MEQTGIIFPLEKKNNLTGRGTTGLAKAMAYLCAVGYICSLPISDNQPYDLIIDGGNGLKRVEVKTTTRTDHLGTYQANVARTRFYRTTKNKYPINSKDCDYLFVYCFSGDSYFIPIDVVDGKTALSLGKRYQQYNIKNL